MKQVENVVSDTDYLHGTYCFMFGLATEEHSNACSMINCIASEMYIQLAALLDVMILDM
jgi:hypothetical protein